MAITGSDFLLTPVRNFPYIMRPLTNITPFTYEDGTTYLEILTLLDTYIRKMGPDVDVKLKELFEEFQKGITNAENTIIHSKEEWQNLFDEFMADVVAQLEGLNDQAVANLIDNKSSLTGKAYRKFQTETSLIDYGAIPNDPNFDNLPAFKLALGSGRKRVFIPAGVFYVSSMVPVPSDTTVFGVGIDVSIIKLMSGADAGTWVIGNSTRDIGNTNIYLHDFTTDWNIARLGGGEPINTGGGSRSTGVILAYTSHSLIERVKSINTGLHGFDVCQSSVEYPYFGDGSPDAFGPSRFVTIRDCIAANFGDDGFTTHHSEFIWIEDCHSSIPRKRGNNNGFEIDDGSRYVTLSNNYSEGCYGGIEIKAHETASAARVVTINSHTDVGSVRSYNFRHIGHHSSSDHNSVSANNITASNLVSIGAKNTKGFYESSATPRGLVISAFKNVVIDGLTIIGAGGYVDGDSAISIQYKATNISISNINISGWVGSPADIVLLGDANEPTDVNLSNINILESANSGINIGNKVNVNISNLTANKTNGVYGLIVSKFDDSNFSNILIRGYATALRTNSLNYDRFSDIKNGRRFILNNVTELSQLNEPNTYSYLSTAIFARMTDKPARKTGGFFLFNSPTNDSVIIQTLEQNTATNVTVYKRTLDSSGIAGAWNMITSAVVV